MATTGTYVYCVIGADRPPAPPRAARLPGVGPVRLLQVEDHLWLAVADAPLSRYGEKAINAKLSDLDWVSRAAIAHEAVVESFMEERAILPMKLFTIFKNDDRALAEIRGDKRHVDAIVKRVANHVEWGIRVTHIRGAVAPARRRGPAAALKGKSGMGYLIGKKAQRDAAMELAGRAQETVAALYERLAARSHLARRRAPSDLPAEGGPPLLDAAFLVPRSRRAAFTSLVALEARRLAARGYHVALSGPWPPYTFVKD